MEIKDSLDPRFANRQWQTQRVIWAVLALLLLATAAGAFGEGFLAEREVRVEADGGYYLLSYERINRFQHVSRMVVEVFAPEAMGETLAVTFSSSLIDSLTVTATMPEADGGETSGEGSTYRFQVQGWSEPVHVQFEYTPDATWLQDGELLVAAGEGDPRTLDMTRLVYP